MSTRKRRTDRGIGLWMGLGVVVVLSVVIATTACTIWAPKGPGPWNSEWRPVTEGLVCDVLDFGAVPDDDIDDSRAIQNAVDFCAGEVLLEDVAPPSMSVDRRAYYQWWEDARLRAASLLDLAVRTSVGAALVAVIWCLGYLLVKRRRTRKL